ncbi:hypothetical protein DSO57_1027282, partial [Entomophthora muscae]
VMSSSNSQAKKLFPGLEKITQGYSGSSNSEASVYGHSQPAGSFPSTTQECVLSLMSSSMALFAHHVIINHTVRMGEQIIKNKP